MTDSKISRLGPPGIQIFVVALGLTAYAGTACNLDTTSSGGWTVGGDGASSTDTSAPRDDATADTAHSSDTAGGDTPSGREVETTGWYHDAFEKSLFARSAEVRDAQIRAAGTCHLRVEANGERWWARGISRKNTLRVFSRTSRSQETIAKLRATGSITPPGEYGHLGGYDRRFDVRAAELLECETAAKLGECVVPRDAHRCLPGSSTLSPRRYELQPGSQTRGPDTQTSYTLEITDPYDGATGRRISVDFTIPWTATPDNETPWYYQSHGSKPSGAEIESVDLGPTGTESTFESVSGWLRVLEQPTSEDPETIRLYLKATAPDRSPLQIWGTFRRGTHSW